MEAAGRVTIVCIAFNHGPWIEETLESVRRQDYPNLELIVVDNGSTDETTEKIQKWIAQLTVQFPVKTIFHTESQPYCQLFNQVLSDVESQFLVDLSGDDVLYPQHLTASVRALQQEPTAAFVFSDAEILDHHNTVRPYYKRNPLGQLLDAPEVGKLYQTLIRRSCICAPTLVFNTVIFKKEGGYDESLFYEDFDILVRLTRSHSVAFSDHIGVLKRKHAHSMSAAQYLPYRSRMLPSTVRICYKIHAMNITAEENQALEIRVLFELKHALWSANFEPARDLVQLGKILGLKTPAFWMYRLWTKMGWDLSWLYLKLT